MSQFLCPFLVTDSTQIPERLVTKFNLGLEAIFFDGALLNDMVTLEQSISTIRKRYTERLVSIHFPTENADYLSNTQRYTQLQRLIEIAEQNAIRKIVIHSNHFQTLASFDPRTLSETRQRYLELFVDLDNFLFAKNVLVLVENMPIIGNQGDDFDSAFVFPSDFNTFERFKNIGIAWDFGHWAFTVQMAKNIQHIANWQLNTRVVFDDFKNILPLIKHIHMSSFKGMAFPGSTGKCYEGVPMAEGDADPEMFIECVRFLNASFPNAQISLEIQEENYQKRPNLERTLNWLAGNNLIEVAA